MSSINSRMKTLIEVKLPKYGRFKELERLTKIKNATWQTWSRGGQRATSNMIEAIACAWPEHAYWLVTGDELPNEGMTNPTKKQSREMQTLTEFTARVLGTRLAIKDEVMAFSSWNSIIGENNKTDEVEVNEEAVRTITDKFLELTSSIAPFPEHDDPNLLKKVEAEWDRRWHELMESDEQLQELEHTRNRIMAQALLKTELPANAPTLPI